MMNPEKLSSALSIIGLVGAILILTFGFGWAVGSGESPATIPIVGFGFLGLWVFGEIIQWAYNKGKKEDVAELEGTDAD